MFALAFRSFTDILESNGEKNESYERYAPDKAESWLATFSLPCRFRARPGKVYSILMFNV